MEKISSVAEGNRDCPPLFVHRDHFCCPLLRRPRTLLHGRRLTPRFMLDFVGEQLLQKRLVLRLLAAMWEHCSLTGLLLVEMSRSAVLCVSTELSALRRAPRPSEWSLQATSSRTNQSYFQSEVGRQRSAMIELRPQQFIPFNITTNTLLEVNIQQ